MQTPMPVQPQSQPGINLPKPRSGRAPGMNGTNNGLRLPRFQLRAGRDVEVSHETNGTWRPHRTTQATSFNRYESCELGRFIFRHESGWLVRCWKDDFIDFRPDLKFDRWKKSAPTF